ncbi:hypothetical protein L1887_16468 [Cichorium endivia]|nr:hypothetical protein L1887_16468 [Cichorium endivia]
MGSISSSDPDPGTEIRGRRRMVERGIFTCMGLKERNQLGISFGFVPFQIVMVLKKAAVMLASNEGGNGGGAKQQR